MEQSIPTYLINLKSRPERKDNAIREFVGKEEFKVIIVDAIQNEVGLIGLWQTMKYIFRELVNEDDELIIICQDDHKFTEHYSFETLSRSIEEAKVLGADILLGGVSWFQTAFQSSIHLYWTEKFSGLQFAIFFKKFFKPFLDLGLDGFDAGDYRIAAFTDKKWIIYPYISTQRDYGYSDVTLKNNTPERQEKLFAQSNEAVKTLFNVVDYFKKNSAFNLNNEIDIEHIAIPTFIINLPERKDRLIHCKKQFYGRKEFDVSVVSAIKEPIGALGLWKTIRNIVSSAFENDEDVIVICEDDHEFTQHYSKKDFISSIIQSHQSGADILLGGPSGGVNHILPVTNHLCWVNAFFGTQFIVIYKKLFSAILNEPFNEAVTADGMLSELAVNKLSFHPFISIQKDFGYSDVNDRSAKYRHVNYLFEESDKRFVRVRRNFKQYYHNHSILSENNLSIK